MKYYVIADEKCINFFNEFGITGSVCVDPIASKTLVLEILKQDDICTLLVSKTVYEGSKEILEEHKKTGLFPSIVVLDR